MSVAQQLPVDQSDAVEISGPITAFTILQYLVGFRPAILRLASDQGTVWLGLLFVISAGFAREYDGEDLASEPWHLALPLVASLATSFLLFVLLYVAGLFRCTSVRQFIQTYRSFLGLYWMTAPLAWIYAIPVERFLSDVDAVSANLNFLTLVSIWRVILITRVISVVFCGRAIAVFPVVMLFADVVALSLVSFMPSPGLSIMAVMGGVRLTPVESVISSATLAITVLGWLSLPVWLLAFGVVCVGHTKAWFPKFGNERTKLISWSAWSMGSVAIAIGLMILSLAQPEQQLRRQAEVLLRTGRLDDAIQFMGAHGQDQFPPHWDPPPRLLYPGEGPSTIEMAERVVGRPDDWVRRTFMQKFRRSLGRFRLLSRSSNEDRLRVLKIIEQMQEKDEVLEDDEGYPSTIDELKRLADPAEFQANHTPSEEVRQLARKLVEDFENRIPDRRKRAKID